MVGLIISDSKTLKYYMYFEYINGVIKYIPCEVIMDL